MKIDDAVAHIRDLLALGDDYEHDEWIRRQLAEGAGIEGTIRSYKLLRRGPDEISRPG
jgi:hypothetical protein